MTLYILSHISADRSDALAAPKLYVFTSRETAWAWLTLLRDWDLGMCFLTTTAGGLDSPPAGFSYADLSCHVENRDSLPMDPRVDAFVRHSLAGVVPETDEAVSAALAHALRLRGEVQGSYFERLAQARLWLRNRRLDRFMAPPDSSSRVEAAPVRDVGAAPVSDVEDASGKGSH